jgi:hypothetical protein
LGSDAAPSPEAPEDRYDGVGILAPVISRQDGAPPFALTDGGNQVLMFVSPAPGVNLRAYVGQTVGLSGIRGFLTERGVTKPHVTAKRVTVLQTARRR